MFRLLLIFTASLALARPTLAGEIASAPSQTGGERQFLMGLTPMNFDESPAGTERMTKRSRASRFTRMSARKSTPSNSGSARNTRSSWP